MREVAVLGVGLHRFGRLEKSVEEMGREAILAALNDAGMDFKDIEVGFSGRRNDVRGTGLNVFSEVGRTGIPIHNVEKACASSSTGLGLAYAMIGAGLYDTALCIGVEWLGRGLLTTPNIGYEEKMGMVILPAEYAMAARRHMAEYGTTMEQWARLTVKARKYAAANPYAHYQKEVTVEEVLKSPMIADPLTQFMCAPTSCGASAAILCSIEKARQYAGKPVSIGAWASGTPRYIRGQIVDEHDEMGRRVSRQAYEKAGVGPEDIDVLQVHDAFSPGEALALESIGICPEGEAVNFICAGKADIGGPKPTNTDGGLVGRGHPNGATGIAQAIEIVRQLRGQCGARQVEKARVGLQHNQGYGGINILVYKA
ncbi:MAG: thiolase family protein [Chloroflexi bacterium]|nr:thiolase family protein [Chloroflexota bacterium]